MRLVISQAQTLFANDFDDTLGQAASIICTFLHSLPCETFFVYNEGKPPFTQAL